MTNAEAIAIFERLVCGKTLEVQLAWEYIRAQLKSPPTEHLCEQCGSVFCAHLLLEPTDAPVTITVSHEPGFEGLPAYLSEK